MSGDAGREGEKLFSIECSRAGVTCNASLEDDQGWDHFIQFPADQDPKAPLDRQPPGKSALVQVKATRGRGRSCRIRLSNAIRMAQSPQPFFIVFIQLGANGRADRIFVRHVWRDLIEQFLRAAREADNAGDRATNRRRVAMSFSDSDEQSADPLGAIAREIDMVGKDYAGAKAKLAETIGYEDGYGTAQVTVEMETLDDLADLHLGLRDSVKITDLTYTDERFGVPAGKPKFDGVSGSLMVQPEPRAGELRVSSATGEEMFVPAQVWTANLPDAPPEQRRMRIVAGCLEIILRGDDTAEVRANLKASDIVPVGVIELFGTLLRWRKAGPIDLLLKLDGKQYNAGAIEFAKDQTVNDGWVEVGSVASLLRQVSDSAMVGDVRLSVKGINEATLGLQLFTGLATNRAFRIDYPPGPDGPPRYEAMIGYMVIAVGTWTFAAVAHRTVVEDVRIGDRRHLTFGPARLIAGWVAPTEQGVARDTVHARYEQVLARTADRSVVFELGDILKFYRETQAATPSVA